MNARSFTTRAGIFPALVCILSLCSACASTPQLAPPRPDTSRVERVAAGVVYEYRWYAQGPWAVHTLAIEPGSCGIDFRTVKALDRVVGRETTSALAQRGAAKTGRPVLAAVNADFFSFDPPGISEGPQISNGVLIKSEGSHREAIEDRRVRLQPVFGATRDKKAFVTHTRLHGAVSARNTTVALTGVNVRTRPDGAFVFDSLWGEVTASDTAALELVVRRGAVTAVDTSSAGVAIPRDGVVVIARGSARTQLAHVAIGDSVRWQAGFDGVPSSVAELIGGYPMLLLGGQAVHHAESGLRAAFSDRRHPRVAIGVGKHGRVHVFVVDGRRPGYSAGMSLAELGDFVLAHGIRDALNFDGGGSSTMVVHGRIMNQPTDTTGERAVANALLVLGPAAGTCR